MEEIQKVVREGKTAVLYSPGYGAGWSTWNESHKEILLFHPRLVDAVEKGEHSEQQMIELLRELLGDVKIYAGGASDLQICWVTQGARFTVYEYDGFEEIDIISDTFGFIA